MTGILIDDNGNLQVENGSLKTGNINYQRARLVIEMHKGEDKASPAKGFGISNYLKSTNKQNLFKTNIIKELKAEGLNPEITYKNDNNLFEFDLNLK